MAKGGLPGWLEAKLEWPAGCQSCVRTTLLEALDQPVDRRDDLVAARHGERAAGAEIVLHVDDDQRRVAMSFVPLIL